MKLYEYLTIYRMIEMNGGHGYIWIIICIDFLDLRLNRSNKVYCL